MKLVKDIVTDELQLSERAVEIDVRTQAAEMREIIKALKDTMRAKGLSSLSAPAIGYNRRIFCIDFKDSEIKTFINPIIAQAKGMQLSVEKCVCIPDKEFMRPRNNDLMIVYQRPTGQIENRQIVGMSAIVFQHELDHLDGLLLSDVGIEIDEDFHNASEEEQQEVINAYLDALDIKKKEINTEIETNPELKQLSDGIDFMESVYKGETKIEPIKEE
ncbi:MAG: peptide deformylase [Candidatus Onthovivens sp.]|nr:peptide deformylase [Candidatus Onthovivens sp.]